MQSSPGGPPIASGAQALMQASTSLWLATLSLMTAYMQQRAPAHRLMLARRIARNFDTLRQQECFGERTRARFTQLARRWQRTADSLSPEGEVHEGVFSKLQRLLAR